ncbi:MFS transporter [Corynebacterium hansenii]|uniref:MFS transporter n=1 Tax=Corynebacterium hansenii TaxID=394964 RepID=A0ABV7ZLW3_9CORY|nr:MFS transporter [Corynebacterium hansenii]WJY99394.1 Major Facilitator Superfamily protein [Corynebacterium hansenii]
MPRQRIPGAPLLAGSGLFNFASGGYAIALGQGLFESTGSVAAFTAVVIMEYLGPIILGAVAGSLSDRVNAALLCLWSAALAAVSVTAYLLVPGAVTAAAVTLGIVINILRPFYRAGIFAAGARSVDPADLPQYNMRWTVSVQAGQILGGAAAGFLLSFGGVNAALAAAAVAFGLSAVAMAIARSGVAPLPDVGDHEQAGWRALLRDAVGQPRRFIAVLLIGADFVTISTFTVALAPLVERVFGDTLWLGILDALFALGAGGVALIGFGGRTTESALRNAISRGYITQVAGLLVIASGTVVPAAGRLLVCAGALVLGAGVAVSSSQQVSILQRAVGTGAVGKIGALRQAVIGVLTVLALPVIGAVLGVSLTAAYLLVGALLVLCLGVNVWLLRSSIDGARG